jgi:hypothetical protein
LNPPLNPSLLLGFSKPSVLAVHDLYGDYHIKLSLFSHHNAPLWASTHHSYSPLCYCNIGLSQALQMDELLPIPVRKNQNGGEPTA